MKRYLFLVLIALTSFSQIGCSNNELKDNSQDFILELDTTLRAYNHESVDLEGIKIQFTKVIKYSLCPPDLQCIWAGKAIVELKINDNFIVKIALLDKEISNKITYQNTEIELLEVNPIEENSYTIKLRIFSHPEIELH